MVDAFLTLVTTELVFYLLLSALLGIVLGAIPGLSGIVGLSILLPFILALDETSAIVLIVALLTTTSVGDTIPSVIWGVPGTSGSTATVIDGYPMAKKGQAVRALSASYVAAVVGGVIGAAFLLVSLPVASALVLSVGSPELLMLAVLGLAMVSALSSGRPGVGIVLGLLGMCLGMIGQDPQTGVYRWTFNQAYLLDGISIVPIALGLFGVPALIELSGRGSYLNVNAKLESHVDQIVQGMKDAFIHWRVLLGGSVLGTYVGIVPGIGQAVSGWLAYAQTVQASKDTSQFGKGDVRGVIGPEATNNANLGGALIPTLLFGVPGGLSMVFVLAAVTSTGTVPGPRLVEERPDLLFTVILTVVVASFFAAAVGLLLSRYVARVALVPADYLIPVVTIAIIIAAVSSTRDVGDLVALLAFSLLGWLCHRTGWRAPPIILGFVLGPIMSERLHLSNAAYGAEWLTRPGVIILFSLLVVSLWWSFRRQGRLSPQEKALSVVKSNEGA